MTQVRFLICLLLCGICTASLAQRDAVWDRQYPKQVILNDFDTLYSRILRKHVDPFWMFTKEQLQSRYEALRKEIGAGKQASLSLYDALPSFQQLIALTGDIHASAYLLDGAAQGRLLPVSFKRFNWQGKPAYFITSADVNYKDVLGCRLEKIGDYSVAQVIEKIKKLLPPNSAHADYYLSRQVLRNGSLLRSLGLIKDAKEVTLTLSDGKRVFTKKIAAGYAVNQFANWVLYEDVMQNPPMSRQNRFLSYWFKYLPADRAVYVRYKQVANGRDESMLQFTARLLKFADSAKPRKLIIDIRDNTGGNNYLNHPLICSLEANENINRYGKLFCLSNGLTFSAAICFMQQLDAKTNAIIVGEPPADAPNFCSDLVEDVLPATGLKYGLSIYEWVNTFIYDTRRSYTPELPVSDFSWEELNSGKDRMLEKIVKYVSTVKDESYKDVMSIYHYSLLKPAYVTHTGRGSYFSVPGEIDTRLLSKGNSRYATGMSGVEVRFEERNVSIISNGKATTFSRWDFDKKLPYEQVQAGNIDQALPVYKEQQRKGLIYLRPNNLSTEAYQLYLLRKDRQLLDRFLKLNKTLNPSERFSEYILRLIAGN
jgi:hypothetical protein